MSEEEKDILQDKIIREEGNYFELNQHKALLAEDASYKANFQFKEGIARAAAKEFLKKALETPVVPLEGETNQKVAAARPAASPPIAASESESTGATEPRWSLSVYAIAATIFIAAVSTFFLTDFRSANEFTHAEINNIPNSSAVLFGSGPIARGGFDWRRAFDAGDYNAVIQNIDASEYETKLALGLSKLLCGDECSKDFNDFGQGEFAWILQGELSEQISRTQVLWYNALALYLAGNCTEARAVLDEIIVSEPSWRKKAKKYKRKMEKDCQKTQTQNTKVIGLQPFENYDPSVTDSIQAVLERAYNHDVVRLPVKVMPEKAFDECKDGRYNASILIHILKVDQPDSIDFTLGLVSKDIFVDKKDSTGNIKEPTWKYHCWGIFGLGYLNGPSCVVSTARPKKYCKSRKQFIESMQKISIHEIGHNLGLRHCTFDARCVMRDAAESIRTIHQVDFSLCTQCQAQLQSSL